MATAAPPTRLHVHPAPPVSLHDVEAHGRRVEDLLVTARRAGDRRQILIVSRVLGKHLATDPAIVLSAARDLGDLIATRLDAAPTVIGFAETATALAHVVRARIGAHAFTHTTRHDVDATPVLTFTEPHSHAPDHSLFHRDPAFLADDRPVVLVDDELTTGTTALNTIAAIHAHHPHPAYVVAVLTDLRDDAARARFDDAAARLGARIDVVSLLSGRMDVEDDGISGLPPPTAPIPGRTADAPRTTAVAPVLASGHLGWADDDEAALSRWASDVAADLAPAALADGGRVDVIGWEEAMYGPLLLAQALRIAGVRSTVRATTRSPIATASATGYPITDGIAFDVGDGVPRYLYNLGTDRPDRLVLCCPVTPPAALVSHLAAVAPLHVVSLHPVSLNPVSLHPVSLHPGAPADPLPRPPADFGSYEAADVTFLLTPLDDGFAESSLEEREQALQDGAHYSERLPMEYEPSADYMRLFHEVLARQAQVVADLVGLTARRILEVRGEDPFVLVSLARAGTPVGVLLRRYLQAHHGIDAPHASISIIRDRGIDRAAIAWLRHHHPGAALQFVDGWTGKGAIQRELTAECARLGLDDRMAVLADPGGCAAMPGTRADVLIPSACLNATVSGLVSRTVLTDELLAAGGFHGAKHYHHLGDVDLSRHFVDAISARFRPPAELPDAHPGTAALPPGALPTPYTGLEGTRAVAAAHGIADLNRVKPGLGEAIRVLLRRRPHLLLLREESPDTAPLQQLAIERSVPVRLLPDLHVAACGLIA